MTKRKILQIFIAFSNFVFYKKTRIKIFVLSNNFSFFLTTGPGTTLFHRMSIGDQGQYIGSFPLSNEITSNAGYLYRPSRENPPSCLMRHQRIGEIGWNVTKLLKHSVLPVVTDPERQWFAFRSYRFREQFKLF